MKMLVIAVLGISSQIANADDQLLPAVAPVGATVLEPTAQPDHKDPGVALAWSAGASAATIGLFWVAVASDNDGLGYAALASSLITPSFGHWYSDDGLTVGLGIRAASAAVTIYAFEKLRCFVLCDPNENRPYDTILWMSLTAYGIGMLYDIATAPEAARNYNRSHQSHVTLSPITLRSATGPAYGVGLGASF